MAFNPARRDPPLSRTSSYIRTAPMRAVTSFENLVALANDQERLRDARRIIWRDRGDPVVHLQSFREVIRHATGGGIRTATLGYGIRAGVNIFILIFRAYRVPKEFRLLLIRHALFGADSFRFAGMLGSFTLLYKLIFNSLPLLFPPSLTQLESPSEPPTPFIDLEAGHRHEHFVKRSSQLSIGAQYMRKQSKRWHAAVAGFVAGGLAVSVEAKSRRLVIAQQLFVRGLQGSYNGFTKKHGITVPHGAVWVFSLCCGQILYAFLLRPDTIPVSYVNWIQTASRVTPSTVSMNKDLVRNGTFKMDDLQHLINWKRTTSKNRLELLERFQCANSHGDFGAHYAPCAAVHPWLDTCMAVPLDRFISVFRWMLPIYGALHFIPTLLFKRKAVLKAPFHMLARATLGTGRSAAFLGLFVVIFQTFFCFKHNLYEALRSLGYPRWICDIWISKWSFWLGGFLSGLSLFVEERRRRAELAMYVLPKGMESIWKVARGKGILPTSKTAQRWGAGESLLTAVGMAMVMSTYQFDPQHLSGLVRRILYQFVGPN